jgi:catechol 2,3-dioxygenase-like lactoylglutathione lyase family enzyme
MIIVADITKSKQFYIDVLHEETELDLGNYVVFKGGFSMMTREQWNALTNDTPVTGNAAIHSFELYFEEDNIDAFVQQLDSYSGIIMFTPLEESPWGQRTVRFLDPDKHVIEVAESMEAVVNRFLSKRMTVQEVAEKTFMPVEFVQKCYDER